MESRDLIEENLERSMNRVLSEFEGLEDAPLTFPTSSGGCHPLWILGHLAFSEGYIIRTVMLGEANPLEEWKDIFDRDTEAVADGSTYPPFTELLTKCRDSRAGTLTILDMLAEEDLDKESKNIPPGAENTFGTYRRCFQLVADHFYMHRGQVADARRMANLVRTGA